MFPLIAQVRNGRTAQHRISTMTFQFDIIINFPGQHKVNR